MKRWNPYKYINKDEGNGFTLIEVLIAIVILTVGLLGMASLTGTIIRGNKFSNDLTTATTLAQDKMEDIRRIRVTGYLNVLSEMKALCSSPDDQHKIEVSVTDDSPAPDMKTVSVKVYWGGASMEDHNVELKTIFAK